MRDFEFRAWDTLNKVMEGPVMMFEPHAPVPLHWGKSTFVKMIATGLKDKHGKEIWEGDILEDDGQWYEVAWCGYRGAWLARGIRGSDHDIEAAEIAASRDCCCVGNIHENPELLA